MLMTEVPGLPVVILKADSSKAKRRGNEDSIRFSVKL